MLLAHLVTCQPSTAAATTQLALPRSYAMGPDWLQVAHLAYAGGLLVAWRTWRPWRIDDKLERADDRQEEEDEDEPATVFPRRSPSASFASRALSFPHLHHRVSLVLHLLFLLLAYCAVSRVQEAASIELQHAGLIDGAYRTSTRGGLKATTLQHAGLRHPNDAADLIPRQRGGRLSVKEIMERDVAHLLRKQHAADQLDPDEFEGEVAPKKLQPQQHDLHAPPYDASLLTEHAAPALLFHLVSLPLALAHLILYSPWSFTDARRFVPTSLAFFLKPRWRAMMQATFGTGWLMQISLMATMYCLLTVENLHPLEESSSAGELADSLGSVHPYGLLTGLLYLPFFLFHSMRFFLSFLHWWRFDQIYPQVGKSKETVRQRREKEEAKRQGKKTGRATGTAPSATTVALASASSSPTVDRMPKRVSVTGASSSSTMASRHSESSSEGEQSNSEGDEEGGMDMEMLRELASFAPSGDSSAVGVASLDPNADPMAPSAVIQKLRQTPKLLELLEKQQKDRLAAKQGAKKKQ